MKNIILIDCKKEQIIDFLKGLQEKTKISWEIEATLSNWGRTSLWLKLKRYLMYFYVSFKVFCHRKEYNKIVGWQQFYALIFVFYCRIFKVKKTFSVYIMNFTYKNKKGIIGKIYFKFMRYILQSKYIDGIHVPSREYASLCAKNFHIKENKFCIIPFGIPDLYGKYSPLEEKREYILAIGRSNRDYDWLINEWRNISINLYIISDEYKPINKLPSNVKVIDNVSGEKQYPYILGCKLLILPIKNGNICSGDTVLLTAMALKKTVIVTFPSTLSEMYLKDGENGFLVNKNHGELKKLLITIKEKNIDLGENARKSYLENFSRISMGEKMGKIIQKIENID